MSETPADAKQLVLDVNHGEIAQINVIVTIIRRDEVDDHQQVGRLFLDRDALLLHRVGQLRHRQRHAVLHHHQRRVQIGAQIERDGQRVRSVVAHLRGHVEHALTPLTCCSIGAAIVSATTAAGAGIVDRHLHLGGVIGGYCAIGKLNAAIPPASVMTIDNTDAKIGRSMKNWEIMPEPLVGRSIARITNELPTSAGPNRRHRHRLSAFFACSAAPSEAWDLLRHVHARANLLQRADDDPLAGLQALGRSRACRHFQRPGGHAAILLGVLVVDHVHDISSPGPTTPRDRSPAPPDAAGQSATASARTCRATTGDCRWPAWDWRNTPAHRDAAGRGIHLVVYEVDRPLVRIAALRLANPSAPARCLAATRRCVPR